MRQLRNTTVTDITRREELQAGRRSELVRLPAGADTRLFSGWGIRL